MMRIVTPLNLGKVIVIAKLSKIMMMRFALSTVLMLMLMMMLMMLMLMLMTWVSPLTARNLPIRGSSGHTVHCQGDGIETMMMKSAQDILVQFSPTPRHPHPLETRGEAQITRGGGLQPSVSWAFSPGFGCTLAFW